MTVMTVLGYSRDWGRGLGVLQETATNGETRDPAGHVHYAHALGCKKPGEAEAVNALVKQISCEGARGKRVRRPCTAAAQLPPAPHLLLVRGGARRGGRRARETTHTICPPCFVKAMEGGK